MNKRKIQSKFVEQIQGTGFLEKFFLSFPETYIFIKDLKGQHMMVNFALSDIKKYKTPLDYVGTTDYDFCPKELADQYRMDDEQVMNSGIPVINREEKIRTEEGLKWFTTTKIPLFNNKKQVIGLVGITKGVDKYKKLLSKIERQNKKLEKLSKIDSLTGCYNQRYLQDDIVERIMTMGRMKSHNLSILSFDLDDFKKVNDTYGHLIGDKVLIRFCKEVRKIIRRKTDSFVRQGGDEFALILFGTTKANAILIAKKIQGALKNIVWPKSYFKGKKFILTSSIGISIFNNGDTLENIIHNADKALYKAKRRGKNRIEFL